MNILAINPGHNGAAALLQDGKLAYYIEEERLSRSKYDGNPYKGMLIALQNLQVDVLLIGGTGQEHHQLPWTGEDSYTALARKFWPNIHVEYMNNVHHIAHAAQAFYNSGFDSAVSLVVDGAGSRMNLSINTSEEDSEDDSQKINIEAYETESIFKCNYESGLQEVFRSFANNDLPSIKLDTATISDSVTITKTYEGISEWLGFGPIEAGKTMGLAPYGKYNERFADIFYNGRGNRKWFKGQYPRSSTFLIDGQYTTDWMTDASKIHEDQKDVAFMIQHETEKAVGDLIEYAIEKTGETNVVISGGYGLNCVANYYYKKRFPDVNFYIDPISHDGGTTIGMAKLYYHQVVANHNKAIDEGNEGEKIEAVRESLTTLYLGPHVPEINYSAVDQSDELSVEDVDYEDVAELLKDRNIVAMWQGRSEAGPRALGNRSILYDPTDPDGKDFVNKVKGREWFRPFAGSMLQEHFEEWFETAGLEESPYMMYAIKIKDSKVGEIPAITHVDDTCRIQTVTKDQNEHYYNLIKEFYKLTNVPIVFNTSFNLAGDPLVETIDDAINTIMRSDIKYLYLPDDGKLITKN